MTSMACIHGGGGVSTIHTVNDTECRLRDVPTYTANELLQLLQLSCG